MNYTPGVCNINDAEVSFRKQAGYFFGIMSVILVILLLAFSAHPAFGFLVAFPLAIATVQYLQVRNRFCAGYGLRGMYSSGDDYKQVNTIKDVNDRRLDRKKSIKTYVQGVILGLLGSVLAVLIINIR